MTEVQNCEEDAIPAPFSLAQQWVGINMQCWVSMVAAHTIFSTFNHGNQGRQKGPRCITGFKYKGSIEGK
jgi:hypothetical protein